jgi:hypothetical protein
LDVGQSTDPIAPNDAGTVGTVHVVPPSEETSSSPAKGPAVPGDTPALTHSDVVGHDTPSKVVLSVGIDTDVQSCPPSFDCTAPPCPTATQSVVLGQSTALSSGSFSSSPPCVQVLPPSLDVEATPLRPASPPTATHSVAEGHETALKLPLPTLAPPDVAMTGALVSP